MKHTVLNLLAVALLAFSWTTQAAETVDNNEQNQLAAESSAMPPVEATAETVTLDAAQVEPATPDAAQAEPVPKNSKHYEPPKRNQPHPKSLDLRQCLELTNNVQIAYCAGE